MEFRILGPLEAWENGRPVALPGPKPRALLAVLLLRANRTVSAGELIDALWGERPPDTANKVLQTYVSQLRKALPGVKLETRLGGYELRIGPEALDLQRFDRLAAAGRSALEEGQPGEAAGRLRDALELWRGQALGELRGEISVVAELRRLEEMRLAALEDRIEADLRCGRSREVVPELEALVSEHPLRERLRGQLMLALYRSGRQADALRAYQEARRTLVDELGLEPVPELQRLEKDILVQDPALDAPALLPSVGQRTFARRRRLPVLAGAFVVLAGALAGGLYASLGSSAGGVTVPPNSVAAIDPHGNRVSGSLSVGVDPRAVTFGGGSVWVANVRDETLSRIDPASLQLQKTIALGDYPSDVAVGLGATWVVSGPLGQLVRVTLDGNDAGAGTPIPNCGPRASLAIGAGSLWVVCDDAPDATRIDPRTRAVDRFALRAGLLTSTSGAVVPHFSDTAFANGELWIVDRGRNQVVEIDPSTTQIVRQVSVGRDPAAIAAGFGAVWVANRQDDSVSRIQLGGLGGRVSELRVGRSPVDVVVDASGVWVAEAGDRAVSRIDPETSKVSTTIRLGNVPRRLAVGAGRIWVTVGAP
jgi:YVTN family beta-propeller protein